MKVLLCFLIVLYSNYSFSQAVKDTSYTIVSEYKKQIKKYPFIEIVASMPNKNVLEQKNIEYASIGNRKLHLDSYIFNSNKKLPAVILIHDGGWKSGDKSMLRPFAEQISKKGYQCFAIEYRLSDEAKYPAGIQDVLQAIEFVKKNAKKFNVNVDKIAILGRSSGGQMASLIGTKFNNDIKAIINIDGILAFHHPESSEGKYAALWLGGTYEEISEIWNDASALSHVNEKTPPILFINSQHERFHAGRNDMIEKLNTYKIDSKVIEIPDSPHTFWLFHPWFDKTIEYTINFLDEKLKS